MEVDGLCSSQVLAIPEIKTIDDLPVELLVQVFRHAIEDKFTSIRAISTVCRFWYDVSGDNALWGPYCRETLGLSLEIPPELPVSFWKSQALDRAIPVLSDRFLKEGEESKLAIAPNTTSLLQTIQMELLASSAEQIAPEKYISGICESLLCMGQQSLADWRGGNMRAVYILHQLEVGGLYDKVGANLSTLTQDNLLDAFLGYALLTSAPESVRPFVERDSLWDNLTTEQLEGLEADREFVHASTLSMYEAALTRVREKAPQKTV
ncbi:MAG: F-box protein [Chlamydiales bacterium]|nr:F-box protein [Chlamydiales bacterium]